MPDQSESKAVQKRKVGRSPAYPYINVQKAIEKTKQLHEQEGDYAAPLASVTAAWGYSPKSSGARQTLATLKYYGLIDVQGDGDTRKVKVSEIARRILLDQREDETEKKKLVRQVALSPAAHKAVYEQYPAGMGSDSSVNHFLIFDLGFNREAASELLAEFKETARYAGLYDTDKNLDKISDEQHTANVELQRLAIQVGDRIQWTSAGVDQFPKGATVVGFSDDNQWLFTDQSSTGIPVRESTVMEPPPLPNAPLAPAHLLVGRQMPPEDIPVPEAKKGFRKAVFPVDEGDVTLIFPENMSPDGLAELGQYLDIFLKKEQKKAGN